MPNRLPPCLYIIFFGFFKKNEGVNKKILQGGNPIFLQDVKQNTLILQGLNTACSHWIHI
jgi:hypothetical protein